MRGRVLVATDDTAARERIARALDAEHALVTAEDPTRLTDVLSREALDVAVVEATWVTEDVVAAANVPVVAIVDRDATASEVALSAGAVDVVTGSISDAHLQARIGLAVRLARAEQDVRAARVELAEVTRTDHLSGLANRRHLDEHLAMASSAARRHRQPMSLLIVDIDHLKRVNDAIGHTAGDAVIRALGRRVARVLRGEDMAGRWGGDELLVVAPSTDLDGAWRLGERIREAVSEAPIALDGGQDVLITVSIGCSTGPGDDVEAQLRHAESALDQARAAGRNRVVVTDASIMS